MFFQLKRFSIKLIYLRGILFLNFQRRFVTYIFMYAIRIGTNCIEINSLKNFKITFNRKNNLASERKENVTFLNKKYRYSFLSTLNKINCFSANKFLFIYIKIKQSSRTKILVELSNNHSF